MSCDWLVCDGQMPYDEALALYELGKHAEPHQQEMKMKNLKRAQVSSGPGRFACTCGTRQCATWRSLLDRTP